jgi:hypothetical protein
VTVADALFELKFASFKAAKCPGLFANVFEKVASSR